IEVPPYEDDVPFGRRRLIGLDHIKQDATNLEAALKLAQASFSEDEAKRIVVVTDGNQTLGDAQPLARALAANGIGVDVAPIELSHRSEVAVEKVTLPENIRIGEPILTSVVINNMTQPTAENAGGVRGKLVVLRKTGKKEEVLAEQPLEVAPGKKALSFEHVIERPDFYTYEARFLPDARTDDTMPQNNIATAYTHVRGKGSVLLIEDWTSPGEYNVLVDRLRRNDIEVDVMATNELFTTLAELQRYDCVILAGTPRSSGADAGNLASFSDQQIDVLVRNTQQMGCGLIMIGGPQTFGAGGWANSELEKAMPVDFTIKDAKVVPVGALALLMHASEMPQGNYWQKVIAREALQALGNSDYCGLIHYANTDQWLWSSNGNGLIKVGPNRPGMMAKMSRMTPGDMPQFDPSLQMALRAFNQLPPNEVAIKHMIIISDGDPSPANPLTLGAIAKAGIKITTVAIGTHGPANSSELKKIASATGGKYYQVTNPKALPRIYQREARRLAQPLVKDRPGMVPLERYPHEITQGIDGFPAFDGYVMTTVKDNPLVDVALLAPDPAQHPENATLLASWTFGLGRTVAFTSDAGRRWTHQWTGWEGYDKFYTQMVRWAMRPSGDDNKFSIASEAKNGKVRVVVTALDPNDEFLNFLNISGSAVDPRMETRDFRLEQVAPGRYVGEFDADESGSYFLSLLPGPGAAPLRTGVNVPYSAEFRQQFTNYNLLESLTELKPVGGEKGEMIRGKMELGRVDDLLEVDTFRHNLAKAISSQPIWPLLAVICAVAFFHDVFLRRVTIGLGWLRPIVRFAKKRLGYGADQPVGDRMNRLRMSKAKVISDINQKRANRRFESDGDAAIPSDAVAEELAATPPKTVRPPAAQPEPEISEEENYTSRLLKAKRQARRKQARPGDAPKQPPQE
ncbi:MAG: glutamine amidotransferase, partial [Blastopirellula sp. JB062]